MISIQTLNQPIWTHSVNALTLSLIESENDRVVDWIGPSNRKLVVFIVLITPENT